MAESAVLNIRVTPRRMLSKNEAAAYVGISTRHFQDDCSVSPIEFPRGKKLYDMRDLDEWLDGLKSSTPDLDDDIVGRLN